MYSEKLNQYKFEIGGLLLFFLTSCDFEERPTYCVRQKPIKHVGLAVGWA
jgi:hypothetical protein